MTDKEAKAQGGSEVTQGLSSVLWDDLDGWGGGGWAGKEVQEGGDICVHTPDLLGITAEMNSMTLCGL